MATGTIVQDSTVVLNVSWETYEKLLADLVDSSAPRLTFDRGELEIMSPTSEHERLNRTLALLVEVLAEELGLDVENLGSTTFKRRDRERGFEPDSCFYLDNAEYVRGKDRIDLSQDPPPELVIEIDITSASIPKMPIYASIGVPEVWRYDGSSLRISRLEGADYQASERSAVFPLVTSRVLEDFLEKSREWKRPRLLKTFREWVRKAT